MPKIIDNGTTVLIADEGMIFTDGTSFGTTVRLGKEADETEWYKITVEEYQRIVEEQIRLDLN